MPGARAGAGAAAAPVASLSPEEAAARADAGRMKGDSTAPIWLVVASDFECPYCRMWHEQTEPRIDSAYVRTGRVRVAFVNFPLPNHRHAMPAAEAAMCASVQGRFWQVHDAIFATQERWMRDPNAAAQFAAIAAEHVPDVDAWRRCVETGAMRSLIEADRARASQAGVNSTPSFFVDGRPLRGAQPFPAFQQVIDAALQARGR